MDSGLNPQIRQKLEAFGQRRRRLILIRGVCAAVATTIAAMSVVAAVDWSIVLPDSMRLAVSGMAYAGVLVIVYATCLRWILHRSDLRDLARMLEQRRKEFHEEVLSAVELGQEVKKANWDSVEFRQAVQESVGRLVERYPMEILLPGRLVRRWVVLAAMVFAAAMAMMFSPNPAYRKLMLRAMIPTANLARASEVRIRIIEPAEPEGLAPRGDPLTIVAEISDPQAQQVQIESFDDPLQRTTLSMEPTGQGRFRTTLVAAKDRLTYRVYAGKSSTRYYTIETRRRPHVVKFTKTFRYPEYSRLPERTVVEENGDLRALQGTVVTLEMETDQPVESGQIRIQQEKVKEPTILEAPTAGPTLLRGQITLNETGTYRVHLVGQETKFDNPFAPNYELKAEPDLVPRVTLERPGKDAIVPSDELIALSGKAQDDLGLREVRQQVRVNGGPWEEKVLDSDPGKETAVQRSWDLLELRLRPGDQVATRLTAVDLKGNIGESPVVNLTISSPGFSAQRTEQMQAGKNLRLALEQLRQEERALYQAVQNFQEHVRNQSQDQAGQQQKRSMIAPAADRVEQQAEAAWAAIQEAIRQAQGRRESENLSLLGRMLSRNRHHALARIHGGLASLPSAVLIKPEKADSLREAADTLHWQTEQMVNNSREMLAERESEIILGEVERLMANQIQMIEQARSAKASPEEVVRQSAQRRLLRQQQAAMQEQQVVEEMLAELPKDMEYRFTQQVKDLQEKLQKKRTGLEEALKGNPGYDPLLQRADEMQNTFREVKGSVADLRWNLSQKAQNHREELRNSLSRTVDEVSQAKWKTEELANRRQQVDRARLAANPDVAEINKRQGEAQKAEMESNTRWTSAIGQLKDRAKIDELRPDAQYRFSSDAANTAMAMETLETTVIDTERTKKAAEAMTQIERAFRILEAGNTVAAAKSSLDSMRNRERWDSPRGSRSQGTSMDWEDWTKLLGRWNDPIREAFAKEIHQPYQEMINGEAVRKVREEMDRRRQLEYNPGTLTDRMDEVGTALSAIDKKMQPVMDEARKILALYAPSLLEQLAAVEETTQKVQEKTAALAEESPKTEPAQVQQRAQELANEQERLNNRVETVQDSLRRDANLQDLRADEGRERSRDADDAIALLQQPPPKAQDLLDQAAQNPQSTTQQLALQQAATQQQRLETALEQIQEHYANLEQGKPEPTRTALRQTEKALATAEPMQQQYDRIEQLARLGQCDPQQLKAMLEQELPKNATMRDELTDITKETVEQTQQSLQDLVKKEADVSARLDRAGQNQKQQVEQMLKLVGQLKELNEQAKQIGEKAQTVAANAIPQAAKQSKEAGADSQPQYDTAQKTTSKAGDELRQSQPATANQLGENLRKFAQQADQSREELKDAAGKTMQDSPDEKLSQRQAAAEKAVEAGQQMQTLANQARELDQKVQQWQQQFNQSDKQLVDADRKQQELAAKAKDLSDKARALAKDEIAKTQDQAKPIAPAVAQDLQTAQQTTQAAAEQMSKPMPAAAALARQAEQFAGMMDQARQDLQQSESRMNDLPPAAKEQAKELPPQVRQEQQKAQELAQQGRDLARQLNELAGQDAQRLEQSPQQQQQVNQQAPQVAADIQRIAAHAQRLQKPDAPLLSQVGQAMDRIAEQQLPAVMDTLQKTRLAEQARPPVETARKDLEEQSRQLQQVDPDAWPESANSGQPEDPTGTWMARTLDQLEAAEQNPNAAAQQAMAAQARQSMEQSMQSMQRSMAQARTPAASPAQSANQTRYRLASARSSRQTTAEMPLPTNLPLPDSVSLREGKWGQLRSLNAADLMDSKQEAIAEDYRQMVSTYFQVIAEKAKEKAR
jgi:hypothetical protein